MKAIAMVIAIGLALALSLLALGCADEDDNSTTGPGVNHTPVIWSVKANPDTVNYYIKDYAYGNEKATLSCIAMDEDKDHLEYIWESSDGFFLQPAYGPSVQWAIRINYSGEHWIRVIVSDGIETVSDSVRVFGKG